MKKFHCKSAKALLVCLFISACGFCQEFTSRPNILFIVVDDLRPELGCYGNNIVKTPNIDRLAANSTVFLNAYCQQAVCSPSRSSVLTGLRPNSTKVWDLTTHFRTNIPQVVTLPQYFKQNGYYAQCIGKIYHDPKWAQDSLSWSAPEIEAVTDNAGKYVLDANVFKPGEHGTGPWKAAASESAEVPDSAYIDGKVADAAVTFLRKQRESPFFLAVGFRRPHLPFSAPKKYWDLYDRNQIPLPKNPAAPKNAPAIALHNSTELRGYRDIAKTGDLSDEKTRELIHGYYASISYIDTQLGKLLDALKSSGKFDNTIIVLWSDHGFHLGEQTLWAKTTNYELDARVPLIIKSAGTGKPLKTSALVELVDIYPTLAAMCKLPVAASLEGMSLVPLLNDPRKKLKKAAFTQFPRPAQFKDRPKMMGYSVRTERFRYTEWQDFQTGKLTAVELYDHKNDPAETTNVADEKKYITDIVQLRDILKKAIYADHNAF
jgi:iduronate 2-sulfatase